LNAYLAFALTALIVELTPGPNMGYLVMTALTRGRATALVQVAGIALGLLLAALLSALGLSRLFELWPPAYEIVRWIGIGYLLWLAYDAWCEAAKPELSTEADETTRLRFFLRGLYSNLLNPKAYIFYVSVIPSFFTSHSSVWLQAASLGLIYLIIATAIHLLLVVLAGHLQPYFVQRTGRAWLGRAMAFSLVLIALWMIISTHRG
jgi:threonine/homoserine/homoserine lactone efflux protein